MARMADAKQGLVGFNGVVSFSWDSVGSFFLPSLICYDDGLKAQKRSTEWNVARGQAPALGRSRLGMHGARRMDRVKKHLVEARFPLFVPSLAGRHGYAALPGS